MCFAKNCWKFGAPINYTKSSKSIRIGTKTMQRSTKLSFKNKSFAIISRNEMFYRLDKLLDAWHIRALSHLVTTMCFFSVVMCEQLHWRQCNPSLTTWLQRQKSVSLSPNANRPLLPGIRTFVGQWKLRKIPVSRNNWHLTGLIRVGSEFATRRLEGISCFLVCDKIVKIKKKIWPSQLKISKQSTTC